MFSFTLTYRRELFKYQTPSCINVTIETVFGTISIISLDTLLSLYLLEV